MGICSSCLGLGRKRSDSDDSDHAHLLGGEYQPQYGTANTSGPHGPQVDTEEVRREREQLEQLCIQTSGRLIDVTQYAQVEDAPASRPPDYARLFADRVAPATGPTSAPPSPTRPDRNGHDQDAEGRQPSPPQPDSKEIAWITRINDINATGAEAIATNGAHTGENNTGGNHAHFAYTPDWKRVETNGRKIGELTINWDKVLSFDAPPQQQGIRAF